MSSTDVVIFLFKKDANGNQTTLDSTDETLPAGDHYIMSNVITQLTAGDTIGVTVEGFSTPAGNGITVINPKLSVVRIA